MTEQLNLDEHPQLTTNEPPRKHSLVAIGAILWVICFAGLALVLIQGRHKLQTEKLAAEAAQSEADDGRGIKQFKLVPLQDGGFDVQAVTSGADDSPWEAEG